MRCWTKLDEVGSEESFSPIPESQAFIYRDCFERWWDELTAESWGIDEGFGISWMKNNPSVKMEHVPGVKVEIGWRWWWKGAEVHTVSLIDRMNRSFERFDHEDLIDEIRDVVLKSSSIEPSDNLFKQVTFIVSKPMADLNPWPISLGEAGREVRLVPWSWLVSFLCRIYITSYTPAQASD